MRVGAVPAAAVIKEPGKSEFPTILLQEYCKQVDMNKGGL
jgi:hypothetical protein